MARQRQIYMFNQDSFDIASISNIMVSSRSKCYVKASRELSLWYINVAYIYFNFVYTIYYNYHSSLYAHAMSWVHLLMLPLQQGDSFPNKLSILLMLNSSSQFFFTMLLNFLDQICLRVIILFKLKSPGN